MRYKWKREDIAKQLHADKAKMQRLKDDWVAAYAKAETPKDKEVATRRVDEINGFLSALQRAIGFLEMRG